MTQECGRFDTLLRGLSRQYLCCCPLKDFDWKIVSSELTWEQHGQIIDATHGHPLNRKYPVKYGYQLNFLKHLLQKLEQVSTEIHDSVYESYAEVQRQIARDTTELYAYKHYMVPHFDMHFTMRESKSFAAEGTTGLCSWQASLALADYLLHKPELVHGKQVIELGAGTGLCGFMISRCCGAAHVLLTDGSGECVKLMQRNVRLNFVKAEERRPGCFVDEKRIIEICQLPWSEIEHIDIMTKIQPDLLLAADVVYDDTVFQELTHAIDVIFKLRNDTIQMLLAATGRNESTLNKFLNMLDKLNLNVHEETVIPVEQSHLLWDRTTPVRIFTIKRDGCR